MIMSEEDVQVTQCSAGHALEVVNICSVQTHSLLVIKLGSRVGERRGRACLAGKLFYYDS